MPGGGAGLAERRASRIGDESAWRLTFFSFPRFKRIDAQKLSAVFFPGHNYRGHGPRLPPWPCAWVGAGPAREFVYPWRSTALPSNPSGQDVLARRAWAKDRQQTPGQQPRWAPGWSSLYRSFPRSSVGTQPWTLQRPVLFSVTVVREAATCSTHRHHTGSSRPAMPPATGRSIR